MARLRVGTTQVSQPAIPRSPSFISASHLLLTGDVMPLYPKEGQRTSDTSGCYVLESDNTSRGKNFLNGPPTEWEEERLCPVISAFLSRRDLMDGNHPFITHQATAFPVWVQQRLRGRQCQGQELCTKVHPVQPRVRLTTREKPRATLWTGPFPRTRVVSSLMLRWAQHLWSFPGTEWRGCNIFVNHQPSCFLWLAHSRFLSGPMPSVSHQGVRAFWSPLQTLPPHTEESLVTKTGFKSSSQSCLWLHR